MQREYAAFLRAISNVKMQPFRAAMEEMGFTEVDSYGMSGNLLFNAPESDPAALEQRLTNKFDTTAFVRTRAELERVVGGNPFRGRDGAAVLFLAHAPNTTRRQALMNLDYETEPPVLRGRTVFFIYPVRLRGSRTALDFERALEVEGTARSARVIDRVFSAMS